MPTAEQMNQITLLLKENKVQEAADLSAYLAAEAKAAEDLAAGKLPEPSPPRQPGPIMMDLLYEIVAHLGNTPRMFSLLTELGEAHALLQ